MYQEHDRADSVNNQADSQRGHLTRQSLYNQSTNRKKYHGGQDKKVSKCRCCQCSAWAVQHHSSNAKEGQSNAE